MTPDLFVSHAKVSPAKSSNKAMGTKMANEWFLHKTLKDEQELVTYKKKC